MEDCSGPSAEFDVLPSKVLYYNYKSISSGPVFLCPCVCLFFSDKVAWRMLDEDGDIEWMPYCAGRRRPGDEEESDF